MLSGGLTKEERGVEMFKPRYYIITDHGSKDGIIAKAEEYGLVVSQYKSTLPNDGFSPPFLIGGTVGAILDTQIHKNGVLEGGVFQEFDALLKDSVHGDFEEICLMRILRAVFPDEWWEKYLPKMHSQYLRYQEQERKQKESGS